MTSPTPDVVVYRTGVLLDADFVAQELDRAGIPNYQRSEALGGPELGMLPSPVPGPGHYFLVKTEASLVASAREVIRTLPVPHAPELGLWAFRPAPAGKSVLYVWLLLGGGVVVLGVLSSKIRLIASLFR